MALPTRATLRTNARSRADQDASDFPSDTQYNAYLDDAARETWWDLRVAGWPVNFSSTVVTASGQSFYPFSGGNPAVTNQVASVHGVYYIQGSEFYPVHRINEGNRAALMSSTYAISGYAGFYDLRIDLVTGPGIELLPPPTSGTYRIDYILEHPGFASDSDTWYGPAGSDSLVMLKAAFYAIKKEGPGREPDAQSINAEYHEMLTKVTDRASWFNLRDPAMIRDVKSQHSRFAFDYVVSGPDAFGG